MKFISPDRSVCHIRQTIKAIQLQIVSGQCVCQLNRSDISPLKWAGKIQTQYKPDVVPETGHLLLLNLYHVIINYWLQNKEIKLPMWQELFFTERVSVCFTKHSTMTLILCPLNSTSLIKSFLYYFLPTQLLMYALRAARGVKRNFHAKDYKVKTPISIRSHHWFVW